MAQLAEINSANDVESSLVFSVVPVAYKHIQFSFDLPSFLK